MAFPPNVAGANGAPTSAPAPMPPPAQPNGAPTDDGGNPITQLTPQDRQALASAPQAVSVIAKLFPELAPVLQAIIGNANAGQGLPPEDTGEAAPAPTDEPDEDDNAQPAGPQYSMPRPATRLGQM